MMGIVLNVGDEAVNVLSPGERLVGLLRQRG